MTRTQVVEQLKKYFETKGKFLSYAEYIEQEDKPFRPQVIKKAVGRWPRLARLIGEVKPLVPVKPPVTKPVGAVKK